MTSFARNHTQRALDQRYVDAPQVADGIALPDAITTMAARGSCRAFLDRPIAPDVLNLLCAAAMAAPSKSDLQQRDIILLKTAPARAALAALVPGQPWVADAPLIAVFCGNNRRQRLLHRWHGLPFSNNHLDALFNAVGDAAIALGAFVTAAETLGLGCCPISAVRNDAAAVSKLLRLPDHVFPFAGLALGHPRQPPAISARLPLRVTCHSDYYQEDGLQTDVANYDAQRTSDYARPRDTARFGHKESYSWSDDKVRQYSQPERADFGAFIQEKGFRLT